MPRAFLTLFCGDAFDPRELQELHELAVQVRRHPGEAIFAEGELAAGVFGLSRGVARLYKLLPDGRRQVMTFGLPGEFLGMPIVCRHSVSADAIGEVDLCRFSRIELTNLIRSRSNLTRLLMEFATQQLETAQDQLLLIGKGSAEEKVAMFLVNWRSRLARVTAVSESIPLPMPRQDIADFLGLTLETVSRTLTKFEQRNAIRLVPKGVLLTGLERTPLVIEATPRIPR